MLEGLLVVIVVYALIISKVLYTYIRYVRKYYNESI